MVLRATEVTKGTGKWHWLTKNSSAKRTTRG
jgi:hypothetical protein